MLKDLMQFHQKRFTKTDKKICDWISQAKKELPNNIVDASSVIQVSPSAITRFCQKINLKGWNELVFSIKKENELISKKRTNNNTLNDIVYSLSLTEDKLNKKAIELLCKIITKSEHVYLYGESFTELAATQFARKLNKIGISTTVFNVASDLAIIMPRNNAVNIVISMSGMNPNIKAAAKKIQHNSKEKQKIFAIGSTGYSNIRDYVNEYIGGEFYQSSASDQYELPSVAGYVLTYILNTIFEGVYNSDVDKHAKIITDIAKEKKR